jgi:hypothetical protein
MAKYMSQVPPKPPKRSGSKVVEKPYKGSKAVSGGPSSTGPKPKPKAKETPKLAGAQMPKSKSGKRNPAAIGAAQEMPKKIGGTMGSTPEQAQQRKAKMLLDMRKRMMLRKKQG